jgi:hypothetical protein
MRCMLLIKSNKVSLPSVSKASIIVLGTAGRYDLLNIIPAAYCMIYYIKLQAFYQVLVFL